MILKNNREERCFNGDIGAAHVEPLEGGAAFIHVPLSANRKPKFYSAKDWKHTRAGLCVDRAQKSGQPV